LSQNIVTTIRHILFWSLPATALFIVIRAQFVRVVLGTGAFDWNDTRLTAAILAVFILSLASQAIHLLLVRALYAVENTKLPLYVTLFSSALALVLSTVFYSVIITHGEFYGFLQSIMRLEGVLGIEVLALPLGYSLALIVHSFILLFLSQKELHISIKELVHPFLQSFISALFAGYVAYTALNFFVTTFTTDTLVTILMQGSIAGFLGCAGYVLSQRLFRNAELLEIFKTLERRFTKSDIVVPQDEDTLGL
jgi:putative peptidoglycan lipid II flippase